MPAGAAQSAGTDLRAGILCQLWISARALDEGRDAQGVEGDPERTGVDRGRRFEGLLRVARPRKTANAGRPAHSRWPRVAPNRGAAQGGKLWPRAAFSNRARDSTRRGSYSPYTKANFQFERVITDWRN